MFVKFLKKVGVVSLLIIHGSYALAVELSLEVTYKESSRGLQIFGNTNLPDGTKLGVSIKGGGQDYNIFVKNGRFSSAFFTDKGQPLTGNLQISIFTFKNNSWQTPQILDELSTFQGKLVNGDKIEKIVKVSLGDAKSRMANSTRQDREETPYDRYARIAVDYLQRGKALEQFRNQYSSERCIPIMNYLLPKVTTLQEEVDQLPESREKMLLVAATATLSLCVSCSESLAMQNCLEAEEYLKEAGAM